MKDNNFQQYKALVKHNFNNLSPEMLPWEYSDDDKKLVENFFKGGNL